MRCGNLRQRIAIEQRGVGRDAAGAQVQQWATFWSCYSSITPAKRPGEQPLAAGAFRNPVKYEILIRYHAGIVPGMRVNYGGRIFDIHAVKNQDELNISIILDCVEGASPNG